LTAVTFLDSSGLAALVAAKNRARELGAGICLAGLRDNVAKVLRISGLDQVFEIHAKRDDAVAATGGH
jgi:anti-sigma B factor antagonist